MKNIRDDSMFYPYSIPNNIYPPMFNPSDLENRLSSIERQIKRIDARLSRIESTNNYGAYNTSIGNEYQNSMHMM